MYSKIKWVLFVICFCIVAMGMAEERETGKWKPELGMELISEQQVVLGGNSNFVNLLRLNAVLPVARGLAFEVASISTCMTADESIGGDLQVFSNIDAGNIPFTLSICDFTWAWNECNELSVGVRNMNEDYFVSPVTSLFTNSSCGIVPTIGMNYPIANYPVASVGVHYSYAAERFGLQASVYNGTAYRRFTGGENVFRVCPKSDGLFALTQLEYKYKGSVYFLGVCGRDRYEDFEGSEMSKFGVTLWTYGEQRLTDNLHLMASYSHAFAPGAACSDFAGIGSTFACRRCEFGVFTDCAWFSERREFATELTCKILVNPYIYVQPTMHIIDKCIGSLRVGISF